jgi:hypothetical protein
MSLEDSKVPLVAYKKGLAACWEVFWAVLKVRTRNDYMAG